MKPPPSAAEDYAVSCAVPVDAPGRSSFISYYMMLLMLYYVLL